MGSGLWSPATYMDSIGNNKEFMRNYVMKQKYAVNGIVQLKLITY
ncbi:MAG: hypothetical protein Q8Q42_01220 [Nanoarchaeota archaeon]|nr:hypothetical protein [Nanoarchaeota archaeon]